MPARQHREVHARWRAVATIAPPRSPRRPCGRGRRRSCWPRVRNRRTAIDAGHGQRHDGAADAEAAVDPAQQRAARRRHPQRRRRCRRARRRGRSHRRGTSDMSDHAQRRQQHDGAAGHDEERHHHEREHRGGRADRQSRSMTTTRTSATPRDEPGRVCAEQRLAAACRTRAGAGSAAAYIAAKNSERSPGPMFQRSSRKKNKKVWSGNTSVPSTAHATMSCATVGMSQDPAHDLEEAELGVGRDASWPSPAPRTARGSDRCRSARSRGRAAAPHRTSRRCSTIPRMRNTPRHVKPSNREQPDEQRADDAADRVGGAVASTARARVPSGG